jgi:hypothetical protein
MTSDYADFRCLAAAGFFAVAFLAGFFRRSASAFPSGYALK